MTSGIKYIIISLFSLLLFTNCREKKPMIEYFNFHNLSNKEKNEGFILKNKVIFDERNNSSTLFLCAKIREKNCPEYFKLDIKFLNPDKEEKTEHISLPCNINKIKEYINNHPQEGLSIKKSITGYDLEWTYKYDFIPMKRGEWEISIKTSRNSPWLLGLGFSCIPTTENSSVVNK